MKITRLSWQNYRNLSDGEIVADGNNVVVYGRNGAGKSSIASMLPFVLFGRIPSKSFDERGLTVNNQIPMVTVTFDDGHTFSRSVTPGNKNRTFLDGKEVPAQKFDMAVDGISGGGGMLLINPFEFPNLHWKSQRDFLLPNGLSLPDVDNLRDKLKAVTREFVDLDSRIAELDSQLDDLPPTNEGLDEKIADAELRLAKLNVDRQLSGGKIDLLQNAVNDLNNRIAVTTKRVQALTADRDKLRQNYASVKTTCPTCGAPLKPELIQKARDSIVKAGREANSEIATHQKALVQLQKELAAVREELDRVKREPANFDVAALQELKSLQSEIRRLQNIRAQADTANSLKRRRQAHIERQRQLHKRTAELEAQILLAEKQRGQAIRQCEHDVNAQFRFVKFKLFKILSSSGESRETCEVMLDGVPFASLSKGEKFKAACDVLLTLQRIFKAEMPLMIDDAESYTSNSLVKLPNQLFLFRVTDTDLAIEVQHV